ncbi:MAG: TetR/AcrR family transcriptional regulator [Microbacteriaceae bacterium]
MPDTDAGAKLRAAVLELAAERPVGQLSVTELCRAAGVTRDSFYRFAAGPEELLASAIVAEIDAPTPVDLTGLDLAQVGDVLFGGVRQFLGYVHRRSDVLRLAMAPQLSGPVRAVLVAQLETGLRHYVRTHPEIVPALDGRALSDDERAMLIAQTANGSIGAIERWLALGMDDIDHGVRLIAMGSAGWWFGQPR